MDTGSRSLGPPTDGRRHFGHAHFWQRAMSRGTFIRSATGVGGAALTSGLWMPTLAQAAKSAPVLANPIPGGNRFLGPGTELFHVFGPAPGNELSTITDFDGFIAAAHSERPTLVTDKASGTTITGFTDLDMRFMSGRYIGVDGKHHHGTFGFF